MTMEPRIVELPQFYVVGVGVFGDGKSGLFPKAWDIYMRKQKDMQLKKPNVGYGVEYYTEEFEKEHKWFYMACGEVESLNNIPSSMVGKVIPAHKYAVFTSKGSTSELHKIFQYVYHEWLPKSKYKIADWFDFEYYDERFKGMDRLDSEIDIYIPIVEK
jgi:AraC family transcriptional regulator